MVGKSSMFDMYGKELCTCTKYNKRKSSSFTLVDAINKSQQDPAQGVYCCACNVRNLNLMSPS